MRGFSGFGSALILSPSLSALYGPEVAVPVALLLELVLSGPFVPPAARLVDRRRTALLCVAAAVMVPVGAYLLSVVDERALRWAICALVFARGRDPRLRMALPRAPERRRDGGHRGIERPVRRRRPA